MILGSGLLQASVASFGTLAADSSDSTLFDTATANVAVNPSSRYLYFGKFSGTWKTVWTDTDGGLLEGDETGTYAVTKASDGPAPFDTDDGLATDSKSGSVAAGTTFSHEADCLIEFTVTTLGTTTASFVFRKQDETNYWSVAINSSGGLYLFETISGAPTQRGGVAGVVSSGHRVVIVAEGSTIKGYSNNVLRWTYASATNFATATAGSVVSTGAGGAISDLKTWPRTLSGEATAILNKVSA